jgi:hypothetical protein
MKTAAQLFTSSYLQPNNIDTEFESGGAAVREREKQERKKEKKYGKKVLERVEENVAHKKIRKNLRFYVCSCSYYFPSNFCKKSSSSATHIFLCVWSFVLGGVRLQ